jgi:hypothetical protein
MRWRYLAVTAALWLGAAACGGPARDPARSSVPSSAPASLAAPSASPTPSATSTTPLLSGAAVKPGELPPVQDPRFLTDDQAGAMAFAAYFYRALDWSIATSNPNLLRPISAQSCKTCQEYIQKLDTLAAASGHSEGARLSANKFAPVHGTLVASDFVIQVTFDQDQEVLVSGSGDRQTLPPPPKNPGINYLYMTWVNGQWLAQEIGLRT